MVNSMTGFASLTGQTEHFSWVLEVKSVNARGLDVRIRLSDGGETLEPLIKREIGKIASRGAVNVFLRTEGCGSVGIPTLNSDALDAAMEALHTIEAKALEVGQNLAPTTAGEVLGLRGVFEGATDHTDSSEIVAVVKSALPKLITAFKTSRADEGIALHAVLTDQVETVGKLTAQAKTTAGARKEYVAQRLRENLDILLSNTEGVEEARLEQELALLAVKADITEEIDRLIAHVDAARELLKTKGPIGRKFDFLMQEFNREANTLCSKSGSTELTRIGLELKTVIDQMREQVQNVE
jgi:uncharacterized protein (TIGR00255 family)